MRNYKFAVITLFEIMSDTLEITPAMTITQFDLELTAQNTFENEISKEVYLTPLL